MTGPDSGGGAAAAVRIVALDERHLENMLTWLADEDLRDHIGTVYPVSRQRHAEWYRSLVSDRSRLAMAIETADGEHVGVVGLSGIDLVYRCAELWIYIGPSASRGRGLAAEAFSLLVGYAFQTLGLHRVFVQVFAFNERARRFFEKCGMRPEGILRDAVFKRGRFHDKYVYGLLENEFRNG